MPAPDGLGSRGATLWVDVTDLHALGPAELQILLEACRAADRLERLDDFLTGRGSDWIQFEEMRDGSGNLLVIVDRALSEARQQQNQFKQLVAALRLPDGVTGKKPQHRGGARGAYKTSGAAAAKAKLRAV